MADMMSAWIEIGGDVPADLVSGLLAAIDLDEGCDSFGGEPVTSLDLSKAGTLKLYRDEAPWGEFARIEHFCQERGIAFNRHSDGKYEHDARVVLFRPGQEPVVHWTINSSGEEVVLRQWVAQALTNLRAGDIAAVLQLLEQALDPEVSDLVLLRIVAAAM